MRHWQLHMRFKVQDVFYIFSQQVCTIFYDITWHYLTQTTAFKSLLLDSPHPQSTRWGHPGHRSRPHLPRRHRPAEQIHSWYVGTSPTVCRPPGIQRCQTGSRETSLPLRFLKSDFTLKRQNYSKPGHNGIIYFVIYGCCFCTVG